MVKEAPAPSSQCVHFINEGNNTDGHQFVLPKVPREINEAQTQDLKENTSEKAKKSEEVLQRTEVIINR